MSGFSSLVADLANFPAFSYPIMLRGRESKKILKYYLGSFVWTAGIFFNFTLDWSKNRRRKRFFAYISKITRDIEKSPKQKL